MRLIGRLENEKKAFTFYSYLLSEGIHSTYERKGDGVQIWIYEEDQIENATEALEAFKANPKDPRFGSVEFPQVPPQPPDLIAEKKEEERKEPKPEEEASRRAKIGLHLKKQVPKVRSHPVTFCIIALCVLLYFWNGIQSVKMIKADGRLALQLGLTPIQQVMMFDYPRSNQEIDALLKKYPLGSIKELKNLPRDEREQFQAAQEIPTWKGILNILINKFKGLPEEGAPLFEKIKKGQYWRLFTPCLLHGGLLHILFNMLWVWLLMRQVEERLPIFKLLLLILIIGVVSNLAQYFMSGPYFLGFSGIVVGLVGFIWVRQRIAPWEGYPLNKQTFIFVLIFVGAMFALEIFSLAMILFSKSQATPNIANTAHIVGGITGAILACIPFFGRDL